MSILLPMSEISSAYKDTIERIFHLKSEDIQLESNRSLTNRAEVMDKFFRANAITIHPLSEIVLGALSSIKEHASAIDALATKKTSLLHVRHVQELAAVIEWIVSLEERYEEFSWRWKNYTHVHAVRNKILNLKEPIENQMQIWIESEINNIEKYVNKYMDKKGGKKWRLNSDCEASRDAWGKYSNWLHPFSLKEIFDGINRTQAYTSAEYDWNSHAVHFSPLADDFIEYDLKDFTYHQFSEMSVQASLNIFLKKCWCILKKPELAREMYAKDTFLEAYKFSRTKPEWFSRMVQQGGAHRALTNFCLSKRGSLADAVKLVAGAAPIDPLAIIK